MVLMAESSWLATKSSMRPPVRSDGPRFRCPLEPYPHNYTSVPEKQRTGYIHNIARTSTPGEVVPGFELLSQIAPQFDVLINFLAELFVPAVAEASTC
jgi:hypothetical protein